MVGSFKMSSDKKTHLLVVVDKITKWVEAELVSNCEAETTVKFLWPNQPFHMLATKSSKGQKIKTQANAF